jgi:hypothetical protein
MLDVLGHVVQSTALYLPRYCKSNSSPHPTIKDEDRQAVSHRDIERNP